MSDGNSAGSRGLKTRSAKAAEVFSKRLGEDPELAARWAKTSRKLVCVGTALQNYYKRYFDAVEAATISPMQMLLESPEYKELVRQYENELKKYREDFRGEFGEYPPVEIEDFIEWAARLGWDGEIVRQGKWTPRELMPQLQGYLRRLADRKGDAPSGAAGTDGETEPSGSNGTPAESKPQSADDSGSESNKSGSRSTKWTPFYEVVTEWAEKNKRFPPTDRSKEAGRVAKEIGEIYHQKLDSGHYGAGDHPRFKRKGNRSAVQWVKDQIRRHPDRPRGSKNDP